jgi:hypothetical protein
MVMVVVVVVVVVGLKPEISHERRLSRMMVISRQAPSTMASSAFRHKGDITVINVTLRREFPHKPDHRRISRARLKLICGAVLRLTDGTCQQPRSILRGNLASYN